MVWRIYNLITFIICNVLSFNYAQAALSNAQIAEAFEEFEGPRGCLTVPVGKKFIGDKNRDPNFLTETDLLGIERWSKAGLIALQVKPYPPGNVFLSGIFKELEIAPTPIGLEKNNNDSRICGGPDPKFLKLQCRTRKIENIISNTEVKTAVDEFRVLKGIATYASTENYLLLGYPRLQGRNKFMVLLKFDSFNGKWKMVAADMAGIDEDFKNNNVQHYLTEAGH